MKRALVVAAVTLAACGRRAPPPSADASGVASVASVAPSVSVEAVKAPVVPKEVSLEAIDRVVEKAIARGDAPGAVVEVWVRDRMLHRKA